MKRYHVVAAAVAVAALVTAPIAAFSAGLWPNLPQIGGPSFCASYNANTPSVGGITGQAGQGTCVQTVPAGPATFAGTEYTPFDIAALGTTSNGAPPATANVSILQLGQGPFDLYATAGAVTIPSTVMWFVENATTTNPTITLPANPVQGQMVHIVLGANLTTGVTTAFGTGSTACLPACGAISGTTAGTTYTYVFNASNTTWYQIIE